MKNIASRMANLVNADLDAISVVKKTWGEQFHEAMNVNGGDTNAKPIDFIMHFFAFPWKVGFFYCAFLCFWNVHRKIESIYKLTNYLTKIKFVSAFKGNLKVLFDYWS